MEIAAIKMNEQDAGCKGVVTLRCNSEGDIRRVVEGYCYRDAADGLSKYQKPYFNNIFEATSLGTVKKFGYPFDWKQHGYDDGSVNYEKDNSLISQLSKCVSGDANERMKHKLIFIPDVSVINPEGKRNNGMENEYINLIKEIARSKRQGRTNALVVIGCTDGVLPKELNGVNYIIDIPCPDIDEIKWILDSVIQECRTGELSVSQADKNRLAQTMLGLREDDIRDIVQMAFAIKESPAFKDLDLAAKNAKKQLIEGVAGLSWIDRGEVRLGGLEVVTGFFENKKSVFDFPYEAKQKGAFPPKGILLCGLPGTGKTTLALYVATVLGGLPMIKFDVSSLKTRYLGDTEVNCEVALRTIESISPCVVLIDEIEKVLGAVDSGNAHETTLNVFSKILDWMQKEKEKPIFIIATANKVEKLPPELKRKGRFDEIFFVGVSTEDNCREIFNVHLDKKKDVIEGPWQKKTADSKLKKKQWEECREEIVDAAIKKSTSLARFLNGADIESIVNAAFCNLFTKKVEELKKQNSSKGQSLQIGLYKDSDVISALEEEISFTRSYFDGNMESTALYWLDMYKHQFLDADKNTGVILPTSEGVFDKKTMMFDAGKLTDYLSDNSKKEPEKCEDKNVAGYGDKVGKYGPELYRKWLTDQLQAAENHQKYNEIFRWKLALALFDLRP